MNVQIKQRPVFIQNLGLIVRVIVSTSIIIFFFWLNSDVKIFYFLLLAVPIDVLFLFFIIWRYRYSLRSIDRENGFWIIKYYYFCDFRILRITDHSGKFKVSYNKWLIERKSSIAVGITWFTDDTEGRVKFYLSPQDVVILDAALAMEIPSPFKRTNDV